MTASLYTIRNYRPVDFEDYLGLCLEAEMLEPSGRGVSRQELREILGRPGFTPEDDIFVVEVDGKLVGYVMLAPEVETGRAILECLVHPEHRRRGLASQLLGYAVRRAGEVEVGVSVLIRRLPCNSAP